jgi:hypothetical protein
MASITGIGAVLGMPAIAVSTALVLGEVGNIAAGPPLARAGVDVSGIGEHGSSRSDACRKGSRGSFSAIYSA